MKVSDLARDQRFIRVPMEDRLMDSRAGNQLFVQGPMLPESADGPLRAQSLMHGIFVGEIQALEGAGRTAYDFQDDPDTPYQLKLDMARQAWDEARHCEISVKL